MMKRSEFARASTPESLVEHVGRNAPVLGHPYGGTMESIREATPIVGMISSSALATTLRWMVPP
jgi:hypothetical protein